MTYNDELQLSYARNVKIRVFYQQCHPLHKHLDLELDLEQLYDDMSYHLLLAHISKLQQLTKHTSL
jgi:hypothetical protein